MKSLFLLLCHCNHKLSALILHALQLKYGLSFSKFKHWLVSYFVLPACCDVQCDTQANGHSSIIMSTLSYLQSFLADSKNFIENTCTKQRISASLQKDLVNMYISKLKYANRGIYAYFAF
jgi:hypothetical protein